MSKVSKEAVLGWLKDMGLDPKPAPDANGNWHYTFFMPPNQAGNRLEVFGLKERPRAVVIAANTVLSPQHTEVLAALDGDAKRLFVSDLMVALNKEFTEYNIERDTAVEVKNFVITAVRYDDGLNLDSFARTVSSVFKAQVAGIQCVHQHLGGTTPQGGEFSFKKLGLQ
jgi:hypothetical protein